MPQLTELKNMLTAVLLRNRITLINREQPVTPDEVNLHWWKINGEAQNVGDMLSVVVTEYMCQYTAVCKSKTKTKHLYAVGSIIDGGYQNATVWGSGLLRGDKTYWWRFLRRLDIRCVRGPETRRTLLQNGYSCPEVYGDPAVLMPLIYPPRQAEKKYPYLVIPHYSCPVNAQHILHPITADWKEFIDELLKAELVISSSLHGIILAESYGIPAILLNDHDMHLFKYRDYYHSTGRYEFPIAKSVEEALAMPVPAVPDLKPLQKMVQESFPKDLWD